MLVYFGVRAIFRRFKCMSYPEVYILGRQVDGVYVEYLRRTFYTLSDAKHNADFYNKHYNGEWKILKYGRPITVLGDDD
ncbi:hypothetical protein [Enterococcus faecalis]|jgi:hypothetical protein|uniref:hypothetical protein n=1 Tax=Enterococcus TaxID=1350 RepID=UPI001141FC51|nr:hypothetical protein [Enterococcus faecalis]EGO5991139.1 hypothetical protein [Enterococcus faecalis]EGO7567166.1 hypothetical protein [Enterococcus faecalis]MBP4097093.1 hypothetical protein [Enterococcus faecalis]MDK4395504.1 hypothetical protein [Enterococcus faecalis]MDK4414237.1 hypothetical protein [Enterococcus faecalis]